MNDAILTVLAQVSEQMGFLTPTGPADQAPTFGPVVQVAFHGPAEGVVVVAASQTLAEALARNLLTIDADAAVPAEDCTDALRELANIAAGNLLPILHGDGEYRLDPPEISSWPSLTTDAAHLECVEGTLSACCALR